VVLHLFVDYVFYVAHYSFVTTKFLRGECAFEGEDLSIKTLECVFVGSLWDICVVCCDVFVRVISAITLRSRLVVFVSFVKLV
jgi:hypothetical protein